MSRIYLSPPDVDPADKERLIAALDSGWVAPLGPEVDGFERELAAVTGRDHGVALSSGTAALHLALIEAGVTPGDRVLVSDLTFAATANAVRYVGAEPVFVDADTASWNMDPDLMAEALAEGRYAAALVVDLYGQCADYDRIVPALEAAGITLIEDAAEALGSTYRGRPAGSFGVAAALSFNGNKIITTSGGGALVTDLEPWARHARFLATQARDPAPHYQHSELGFNYRMSNLLAALGRSQLADLERRIEVRRGHRAAYLDSLGGVDGVELMPEAPGCRSIFWLTCITIDPAVTGVDREEVRLHLETMDIESRPVWKPMHLQPYYAGCRVVGGSVSARLFEQGLCLPSGSSLGPADRDRVIGGVLEAFA
jgi:dTDP-4-amino-4,6-dideoxygalactose transaminase